MIYFLIMPELNPPIVQFGLGNGRARLAGMAGNPSPWRATLAGTAPGDHDTLTDLKARFHPCQRPDGWYVSTLEPLASFLKALPLLPAPEPRKTPLIPIDSPPAFSYSDLRAWRDRYALSQPQAAAVLGIPVNSYRQYEQGRVRLPGLMARACQAITLLHPLSS